MVPAVLLEPVYATTVSQASQVVRDPMRNLATAKQVAVFVLLSPYGPAGLAAQFHVASVL